jgi:hypothetical protein
MPRLFSTTATHPSRDGGTFTPFRRTYEQLAAPLKAEGVAEERMKPFMESPEHVVVFVKSITRILCEHRPTNEAQRHNSRTRWCG